MKPFVLACCLLATTAYAQPLRVNLPTPPATERVATFLTTDTPPNEPYILIEEVSFELHPETSNKILRKRMAYFGRKRGANATLVRDRKRVVQTDDSEKIRLTVAAVRYLRDMDYAYYSTKAVNAARWNARKRAYTERELIPMHYVGDQGLVTRNEIYFKYFQPYDVDDIANGTADFWQESTDREGNQVRKLIINGNHVVMDATIIRDIYDRPRQIKMSSYDLEGKKITTDHVFSFYHADGRIQFTRINSKLLGKLYCQYEYDEFGRLTSREVFRWRNDKCGKPVARAEYLFFEEKDVLTLVQ